MKKTRIFLLLLSILTFAGHLILLPRMPEVVPTHWNLYGEIDGYSNKMTTVFLAALPLLLLLLFYFIPKMDPRGENYEKHTKAYGIFQIIMLLFMNAMVWITDAVIFGSSIKINQFIPIGVGIVLLTIGNYMPQIRNNYTLGIKTPWALENEWVWKKTHTMGGIVFCIMGILMILSGVFTSAWLAVVAFASIILGVIWMYLYSYLMYRKWLKKGQEN